MNFLDTFSKNAQISNFMKICPEGAELFHADGQTDRNDEAICCFSQFFGSTLNVSFEPTELIYRFSMFLRISSDYFPKQQLKCRNCMDRETQKLSLK